MAFWGSGVQIPSAPLSILTVYVDHVFCILFTIEDRKIPSICIKSYSKSPSKGLLLFVLFFMYIGSILLITDSILSVENKK